MERNKLKNFIIVILLILLITNTNNISSLKRELRQDHSSFERSINDRIMEIQSESRDLYRNMEELLEKEQSIFSETNVELKLQGDKIAITMHAIPKEIKNDEKLIARVTANGKVYEEETDENNKANFIIDITERIKPGFIIKSDSGIRQESLDELLSQDIFTTKVYSELGNRDNNVLNLWIQSDENELPFTEDHIEKAEFIVVDIRKSRDFYMEVAPIVDDMEDFLNHVKGDVIPATKRPSQRKHEIGYMVDLSEYSKRKDDITYEVYFTLTTKNGIKYITSYNSVATFRYSQNSSNTGSGEEILRPIFK